VIPLPNGESAWMGQNRKNLIAAVECGLDTTTLSAMGTTSMSDFQEKRDRSSRRLMALGRGSSHRLRINADEVKAQVAHPVEKSVKL